MTDSLVVLCCVMYLYLADTHGKHHELPPLPEADVVIHCGDITGLGSQLSIEQQSL